MTFLWENLETLMMVLLAGGNGGNVGPGGYYFRSKQVDTGCVNCHVVIEAAGVLRPTREVRPFQILALVIVEEPDIGLISQWERH
jgi:hypothetical protein